MNPVDYLFNTLIEAFKNLFPPIALLLGGYFIFIKLPFIFLKKNMLDQKKKIDDQLQSQKIMVEKDQVLKVNINNQSKDKKIKIKEEKISRKKTPEELFEISPSDKISQEELKKKYFQLLKKNHPDRVASMGKDFKDLADKNTKEINEAYEKLKKKTG